MLHISTCDLAMYEEPGSSHVARRQLLAVQRGQPDETSLVEYLFWKLCAPLYTALRPVACAQRLSLWRAAVGCFG